MCVIVQFVPRRCPLRRKWTPKHTFFRFMTYLIFAFLTLNTASPAHKEIFGAKFSSFECAAIIVLTHNRLYAVYGQNVQYTTEQNKPLSIAKEPL